MDRSKKDHPLFQESASPSSSDMPSDGITKSDLDLEEAETALLDKFDSSSSAGKKTGTPPPTEVSYQTTTDLLDSAAAAIEDVNEAEAKPARAKPSFRSIARRVTIINRLSRDNIAKLESVRNLKQRKAKGHRKNASRAHEMLNYIQNIDEDEDSDEEEEALFGTGGDNADALFVAADLTPNNQDEGSIVSDSSLAAASLTSDELPLLNGGRASATQNGYDTLAAGIRSTRRRRKTNKWKRRLMRFLGHLLDYKRAWSFFRDNFIYSYLTFVAMPCFVVAWILYYYVGNPMSFDFVPGHAKMSWWLNFFGRQIVTLELARATEWLLLDVFVLGTRFAVRCLGPLVTLTAIQAHGWPFLAVAWSAWDLCLLHGNNRFQSHWFYWTGLAIYSPQANSGAYILAHPLYLRFLLAFLIAGLATTAKRSFVAIYFGRRQLAEFKPRMEKLLADVVLLTEVATLAEEAVMVAEQNSANLYGDDTYDDIIQAKLAAEGGAAALLRPKGTDFGMQSKKNKGLGEVAFATDVNFNSTKDDDDDDEGDDERPTRVKRESSTGSHSASDTHNLSRNLSGSIRLKDLLDSWNEPVNKGDKGAQSTISDVLKFRRALTYMDDEYPFGEAFGPANDRNASIQSAHDVFWSLMKLTPGASALDFNILVLALRDDEGDSMEQDVKLKALRKLFQPDVNNELPMLAFVQSCDAIYKRLRYFRASVSNSSVIDKVLEDILNGFFYFVLTLLLMSLVNFNPWPILVSITSLLVSVSFALGPSLSKYVEGLLLIAVRRPYDLGDRIFVTGAEVVDNPGPRASWFVEDINLFNTTLRFAKTNEVSTVNNWSIASSRIVNCNRSPNAIVFFDLLVHTGILEGTRLADFRRALDAFVEAHPRTWDSVAFVRTDEFDSDYEKITMHIAFRHRNSWQDAARILQNRADLLRYVYETARSMTIQFETPPARRVIYRGGLVVKPPAVGYRRDLLTSGNVFGDYNPSSATESRMAKPTSVRFGKDVSDDYSTPAPGD